MLRFLLPKEISFFEYFDQHIALTVQGAQALVEMTNVGAADLRGYASKVHEFEHKTDEVTHKCISDLHKTFITPIDRGEIHRLITRLDDIMDFADAAASRIALYELTEIREEAKLQAQVLLNAALEIQNAVTGLRNMKQHEKIMTHCIAIHQFESEGDAILNNGLARLFNGNNDPILVIKWKEILESLEKAIDRCQDVAIVIEGVVIETT